MTDRLQEVFRQIDKMNAEDKNIDSSNGVSHPKELIYGQRMTNTLSLFEAPSETLQIAIRAQHIKRWVIPRNDYPMDRPGYLKWRTKLKIFHGDLTAEIMGVNGYNELEIKEVKDLLMKKNIKTDLDSQTLEDVACLVFLQYYINDFTNEKEEEMMINVLRKTWPKMSEKAHDLALKFKYSPDVSKLIEKALNI
ncbi:MAG: hypothetical protein ACJA08_001661 [Cyclobacteriaceae bacterium]|jgi:hypothetical protein